MMLMVSWCLAGVLSLTCIAIHASRPACSIARSDEACLWRVRGAGRVPTWCIASREPHSRYSTGIRTRCDLWHPHDDHRQRFGTRITKTE